MQILRGDLINLIHESGGGEGREEGLCLYGHCNNR